MEFRWNKMEEKQQTNVIKMKIHKNKHLFSLIYSNYMT